MLRSLDQLEQVDASRAGGVFCSGSNGSELKFESPGTLGIKEFLEAPKEFLEVSPPVFDGLLFFYCVVFVHSHTFVLLRKYAATCYLSLVRLGFLFACAL